MMKFNKAFNLRILLLLLGEIFLFSNITYAIDLSFKGHLRVPLLNNSQKDEVRQDDGLTAILSVSKNTALHTYQELEADGKLSDKDSIRQAIHKLDLREKKELFSLLDRDLIEKGFRGVPIQKTHTYITLLMSKENAEFINLSSYMEEDLKQKLLTEKDVDSFASVSKYILLNAVRHAMHGKEAQELFKEFEELPGTSPVLIISPFENRELKSSSFLAPPLGAYHLKSYLHFFGIRADVYDPNIAGNMEQVKKDLKRLVEEGNYKIIGSSIYQPTLPLDCKIAEYLHSEFPGRLFIAGGEAADFNYFRLIDKSIYDAIALGFGEFALLDIAMNYTTKAEFFNQACKIKSLRLKHPVPGNAAVLTELPIEYSSEDYEVITMSVNLKEIPFEDYWSIMMDTLKDSFSTKAELLDRIYTVRMIVSSHCPLGCTFCTSTNFLSHAIQSKRQKPRILSAEQIVWKLELIDRYHPRTRTIFFQDDNFFINKSRVLKLCDFSERLKNRFKFIAQARVDIVDAELVSRLKGTFIQLLYGNEQFADPPLEHMGKRVTASKNIHAIRETLKGGITPFMSLIVFYPTVTMQDVRMTIDQAVQLISEGVEVGYWPMVCPFEGAELTERAKKGEFKIEYSSQYATDFIVPNDPQAKKICLSALERKPEILKEMKRKYSMGPQEKLPSAVDALCFFLAVYEQAGYSFESIIETINKRMGKIYHSSTESKVNNTSKLFTIVNQLSNVAGTHCSL